MVATAAASLVQVPLVQSRASTRPARRTVLATQASADVPRRQALSAAAGAALLLFSGVAQAKVAVPFQDSIRKAGSSSEASMGSYGMEGTKKRGLPKGARLKTFDALREKAASTLQEVTK
ncbi:g13108 [Coccomyxa viridis]|uniref:G13108 protein n=1 Tax=Coccomyxa viridis TaxID=1274662 RepID=A0ABP1GBZ2_9CHLO